MHSSSRRILLTGATMGLAAAALAASPAMTGEVVRVIPEGGAKPKPTPKKGKPTKAEKKAAKRARTHGATGRIGGPES